MFDKGLKSLKVLKLIALLNLGQ
jgi:hypothetical protein